MFEVGDKIVCIKVDDKKYLSLYKEYTIFHMSYNEKIVLEEIISHDFDVTDDYFATPGQLRIMKLNKLKECIQITNY